MKITKTYYDIKPRSKQQETFMRKKKVTLDEIKTPCTLFLDQASNTGYSLFDDDSRLVMTGTIRRGRTSLPAFKEGVCEYIKQLVDDYKVDTLFHEEVYDQANMQTTEVLFYLKHAIQYFGYLNKDVEVLCLAHTTWKTNMAKPGKFNFKTDHKKEIVKWVKDVFPLIALATQDEFDALGMGISVMIKEKGKKNFYKQAKYNKRLPVHFMLHEDVFQKETGTDIENVADINETLEAEKEEVDKQVDAVVSRMRKPFRTAYEQGGLYELELDKRRGVEDTFRRFLSHKDMLVYMRIPKDYKYWGILLLEHGIRPDRFETEGNPNGDYALVACRKKRL